MDNVVDNGSRWRTLIGVISMLAGALFLVGSIPGQAAADPAGNNGTVKIDKTPFDDHPDNEPHVGCTFQVDFYGFDEGDLFADVTFEVHPPTGKPVVIRTDEVFIGEDDNSGGGSEAGLDASKTYDLSAPLQGFEPHPQQGWHVKLTINADGAQGADVKHKVFWVSGCETTPTTSSSSTTSSTSSTTENPTSSSTSSTSSTTSSTSSTTENPTSSSTSSTSSTTESPTSSSTSSTSSTTEKPTSSTASSSTTVSPSSTTTSVVGGAGGRLPETGTDSGGLLAIAGLALLLGGAALFASTKVTPPAS
jgi:LPXTG-motif cell wall-anchored protein